MENRDFYTPPALDAAVNFNSFEYARQRHTISNGDVALGKGAGCCTHFNSPLCMFTLTLCDRTTTIVSLAWMPRTE